MLRPASRKPSGRACAFRPDIATGLVNYFENAVQAAERAAPGSTFSWPTVAHFCNVTGLSRHTLRGWGRRFPELRGAVLQCARIRADLAAIAEAKALRLVFDREASHAS